MIANKTQKIEKFLYLRLVCDEKQRKSEEATIWKHNRKLFPIVCDQSATIFVHVIRFDESEASISDENGVRVRFWQWGGYSSKLCELHKQNNGIPRHI